MVRPIRLFHAGLNQYFIVDVTGGGTVYADLDGDGRIAKQERYSGIAEPALVAAGHHFAEHYVTPFPGARSLDPEITSGGRLNAKEATTFTHDVKGVVARRPDLLGHLDFFDRRDGDGMISLGENYSGWRDLGYGVLKSLMLTLGSAVVFGRLSDGLAIDVERIGEKRPRGSTGIYGPDGNVNQARLAEFSSLFERSASGVLTHDELKAALEHAQLGTVPRRQFESMFLLTERLNGSKTVTKSQLLGLFDNSLFWRVASLPNKRGRRRL